MAENFGMMDGAYFVSKRTIFDWVNDMLKLNVRKIEEFGTGAIYCQIFDVLYPGVIKMKRVKWKAKYEHEYITNLKLLQQGFIKAKIKKWIDVPKLCKARPLDNLELAQWFKAFFDNMGGTLPEGYDPVQQRGGDVQFGKEIKRQVYKSNYGQPDSTLLKNRKQRVKRRRTREGKEVSYQSKQKEFPELPQEIKNTKGISSQRRKSDSSKRSRRTPLNSKRVQKQMFKPVSVIKQELHAKESLLKQIKSIVVSDQNHSQMIKYIAAILKVEVKEESNKENLKQNVVLPQITQQIPQQKVYKAPMEQERQHQERIQERIQQLKFQRLYQQQNEQPVQQVKVNLSDFQEMERGMEMQRGMEIEEEKQ